MLSVWKRFVIKNESCPNGSNNNNNDPRLNGTPPGIQKLDKELQRKFAHGVNYNLKVIIKGDARVGKTALFKRLEGHQFEDNYPPTENLTVTSINWNYKASDNIVKIDLWEAIDPIWRKNNTPTDLKLENQNNGDSSSKQSNDAVPKNNYISSARLTLNDAKNPIPDDAKESLARLSETMDVYKGSNAVLLVFDMTKHWTFKYVQAELPKIPTHIPVLVVANHRDMGHHRTVSTEQAKAFIDSLERNPGDALVMYTEASMKNSFGLKMIDKFFNVSFLKLQEASLLKQLELNRCDYMTTLEELQLMGESVDRDYENYLELKTLIRRQQADAMSPINSGMTKLDENTREKIRNTTLSSNDLCIDKSQVKSIESANHKDDKGRTSAQSFAETKFVNDRLPSIVIGANCALPDTKKIILNNNRNQNNLGSSGDDTKREETNECSDDDDSEEDEQPKGNPLVADYQSDLDSDDQAGKGG